MAKTTMDLESMQPNLFTPKTGNGAASSAAKDPLRPRRKKARRACHACQRAHLTCGDERPCQRCIKRGLQDLCQDGVRKKAKYLHDAPLDGEPSESTAATTQVRKAPHQQHQQQQQQQQQQQHGHAIPLGLDTSQSQATYLPDGTIDPMSMDQMSPDLLSPAGGDPFLLSGIPQPDRSAPDYGGGPIFDPSDPAIFNFDMSALNFGSQYGAMEFGMLGHMTSGNIGTPTDSSNASAGYQTTGFSPSSFPVHYSDSNLLGEPWTPSRNNSSGNVPTPTVGSAIPASLAHGYTIANQASSITSPSPPAPSPQHAGVYEPGISGAHNNNNNNMGTPPLPVPHYFPGGSSNNALNSQSRNASTAPIQKPYADRRPKDPSSVYTSVVKPYSYTSGYHRLLTFIRSRFPPPLLNRVARAMASYRPSFIACTKTLKEDDLVFMERCFQRTLWEYEKFIGQCGTPTIVCRRTGEVAAVGKEFTNLTSWPRDVLLGTAPNLNINQTRENPVSSSSSLDVRGGYTPTDGAKPIFLAELLDPENVVEFYEQFAKLAFGDSRGAVMTKCRLIKYQQEPNGVTKFTTNGDDGKRRKIGRSGLSNRTGIVGAESGMDHLAKDGKVECTFCWTVKRDIFDIPMLIVGNFLPIIRGQFPHDEMV